VSHDICFRCMVSQQPSGGRTSTRVSRLLPVADRSVTTSCIHRMPRHVNSVPRHDARLGRNVVHRLARPPACKRIRGMPSSSHDNLVLARLVPEQGNCLDSEHTTSTAALLAHSCGTRRRRRGREHTQKCPWARAVTGFCRPGIFLVERETGLGATPTIALVSIVSQLFTEAEHA
jgi:hypothetical protein